MDSRGGAPTRQPSCIYTLHICPSRYKVLEIERPDTPPSPVTNLISRHEHLQRGLAETGPATIWRDSDQEPGPNTILEQKMCGLVSGLIEDPPEVLRARFGPPDSMVPFRTKVSASGARSGPNHGRDVRTKLPRKLVILNRTPVPSVGGPVETRTPHLHACRLNSKNFKGWRR